jgi:hypothetical protein
MRRRPASRGGFRYQATFSSWNEGVGFAIQFPSILVITCQALARTWFAQPSLRHLVVEAIKAEHRGVDSVTSARGENCHKVSTAPAAVVLHHGLARFELEMRFLPFFPVMIARISNRPIR